MKKLICLLTALMLLFCTAWAEDLHTVEPHTDMQDFYLDVLIEIDQPDDTILTLPLKLKAFTITYQYNVYRDAADGNYTGFDFDPETVVAFAPILPTGDDADKNLFTAVLNNLNLRYTHTFRPDIYSFSGYGSDGYKMAFEGGDFEVRYNASFFYDSAGNLISVTEDVMNFPYTFTTGSE